MITRLGFFCFNRQVISWPVGKTPFILMDLHEFPEVADLGNSFLGISKSLSFIWHCQQYQLQGYFCDADLPLHR